MFQILNVAVRSRAVIQSDVPKPSWRSIRSKQWATNLLERSKSSAVIEDMEISLITIYSIIGVDKLNDGELKPVCTIS